MVFLDPEFMNISIKTKEGDEGDRRCFDFYETKENDWHAGTKCRLDIRDIMAGTFCWRRTAMREHSLSCGVQNVHLVPIPINISRTKTKWKAREKQLRLTFFPFSIVMRYTSNEPVSPFQPLIDTLLTHSHAHMPTTKTHTFVTPMCKKGITCQTPTAIS